MQGVPPVPGDFSPTLNQEIVMKMTLRLVLAGAVLVTAAAGVQAQAAYPHQARALAATCANCHGTDGQAQGDMKPLAGMSQDKLLAMINDFRSGNQPATIMHQIAKGYTDEQLKLIAGYFAAQKPAK
jgi:cytochrome c553